MQKKLLALVTTFFLLAGQAFAALPNQMKTARMTDSTLSSNIDNEIGNLETAVADVLGIPINTLISNPMFAATAAGLTKVIFQPLAGDPTAVGELAFPTGTGVLKFHTGGGVTTLVGTDTTQTLTNKTLTSPTINGTVATTGLTMPAFAAGGTISGATGITSVGTIATGVWQGTAVGSQWGGTGLNTSASTGVPRVISGTWSIFAGVDVQTFTSVGGNTWTKPASGKQTFVYLVGGGGGGGSGRRGAAGGARGGGAGGAGGSVSFYSFPTALLFSFSSVCRVSALAARLSRSSQFHSGSWTLGSMRSATN